MERQQGIFALGVGRIHSLLSEFAWCQPLVDTRWVL